MGDSFFPVSSGFCSVIKSRSFPLSPLRRFSSLSPRDGTFIVWQRSNSTDEHSVCSETSPPSCRGWTERLLALLLRCFLWLRAGMLTMSAGVRAENNLDSSSEVFQEWAHSGAPFFHYSKSQRKPPWLRSVQGCDPLTWILCHKWPESLRYVAKR